MLSQILVLYFYLTFAGTIAAALILRVTFVLAADCCTVIPVVGGQ